MSSCLRCAAGIGRDLLIIFVGFACVCLLAVSFTTILSSLTLGHIILRATHHAGYDFPLNGTEKIGGIGGLVGGVALSLIPASGNAELQIYTLSVSTVLLGAVTGAIGSAILTKHGHRDEILNPRHAATAGALGGVILGPGVAIAQFILIGFIFKALELAAELKWKSKSPRRFASS